MATWRTVPRAPVARHGEGRVNGPMEKRTGNCWRRPGNCAQARRIHRLMGGGLLARAANGFTRLS